MDVETREAIEALRDEMRSTFATKSELGAAIDSVRGDIQKASSELRGEVSAMRTELRAEMQSMRIELRGHTDVVFESVRDDIRLLAEAVQSTRDDVRLLADGFATLSVKVDALASRH